MIIALFALSIAMIVGGIASVVQGFPFVRLESGLAMTIAGATTASAGAVLAGLAVLAGQVRGLARRLAQAAPAPVFLPARETGAGPAHGFEPSGAGEPALQADRRAMVAGLAAGAAGAAHLGAPDARPQPTFEEPHASPPLAAEPLLPNLLPPREEEADVVRDPSSQPRREDRVLDAGPLPGAPSPAVEVAPASNDPAPFDSPEPPALRSTLDDEPAAARDAAESPAEPAIEVVGTYVSGGNTYVMFSDGSIEAETPRGRFTFESLDELKAFVAAGGEGEARGVA